MRIAAAAAALIVLALAGCAPGAAAPSATPEPTETVVPERPTASAAVISLEGLTVVDQDGGPMQSARFDDPDPMLALLSELLGSTPEPTEYPEFGSTTWEWPGVLFGSTSPEYSWLRVEAAELGDLPVMTTDGLTIGSARSQVLDLAPFDMEYDQDGDGDSDVYGVEQVPNPDYESLSFPGQPGTDFVEVNLVDDLVAVLRSPSSDYQDV